MPVATKRLNPTSNAGSTKPSKLRRSRPRQKTSLVSLPHPLNVKPAGNALFSAGPNNRRTTLGALAILSDELILHLLTAYDLDAYDLARLSCVSSGLRAFANLEATWRSLFVATTSEQGGRMNEFLGSWKRTVAQHLVEAEQGSKGKGKAGPLATVYPESPFYSDLLYLPHRLSLVSLDQFLPAAETNPSTPIPRVDANIATDEFHKEWASQHRPCILRRPAAGIPGLGMSMTQLAQKYGERWIRAEAIKAKVKTYADYSASCERHWATLEQAQKGQGDDENRDEEEQEQKAESVPDSYDPNTVPDESPYYLFDSSIPSQFAKDGLWTVPRQLAECPSNIYQPNSNGSTDAGTHADLFSLLSASRPEYRWLIAGPARSGSGWHKDPNTTSAWNTPLSGRKLWLMLPPDTPPPGVYVSPDGAEVTAPLSLIEWFADFYEETKALYGPARGGDGRLLEGICEEGETMYVPSGWWHAVVNLTESVAMTQNFVSLSELPNVLHFMKRKHEQISGFKFGVQPQSNGNAEDNGQEENNDDDLEIKDGVDLRLSLFDDFFEALKKYDPALAQWALAEMQTIDEQEQQASSAKGKVSLAHNMQSETKGSGVQDSSRGSWWQQLKAGGGGDTVCEDADYAGNGETQNAAGFSLGLADDDDLGEVPW